MKFLKQIIPLPKLAKMLSLELGVLLAIIAKCNNDITPYKLLSSRIDPTTTSTVYFADEIDLEQCSTINFVETAVTDLVVFDAEQVNSFINKNPELRFATTNNNVREDYFDALLDTTADEIVSAKSQPNGSSREGSCLLANPQKLLRPTISEVKRQKDSGVELREIARTYPDFFKFDTTRQLSAQEWDVVKNRIRRFLQGKYKRGIR